MIVINGNVLRIAGPKPLIECEGIMLLDALITRGIFERETIAELYDVFGKALNGEESALHEHYVKNVTPEQMQEIIKQLGIDGTSREEIIKKNLRKAMEDEWKL